MKASPWCPVDPRLPCLPPIKSPVIRAPEITDQVIEQFADEARYVKRDLDGRPGDETCCNFFVVDTCEAQGVIFPRVDGHYMRANDLVAKYFTSAAPWEIVKPWVALDLVRLGRVVVVGQVNPSGPGHVVRLKAPRKNDNPNGWYIGQAGIRNFTHGPIEWGFGSNPKGLVFAVHP